MSSSNFFGGVEELPPDAVFGVKARYNADDAADKVDVCIGAYRTAEGKPLVLECVRAAETALAADTTLNHEYLPITGDRAFCAASVALVLGEDNAGIDASCIASVQALSGTGSLRMFAELAKRTFPEGTRVYLPKPTWGNHVAIVTAAGLGHEWYRYWHPEARALDVEGMIEDLAAAPGGQIVVLHACAHNPTGVDPTQEQWERIAATIAARGHFTVFDSAYQGYASGDLDADAAAVRAFARRGLEFAVCMSYSKNFGLYNERAGCAFVVCRDGRAARSVQSQLSAIARPMYSNPPAHGMRVVTKVLGDPSLRKMWTDELRAMSMRIRDMRTSLRAEIEALGTPGSWNHITDMIGMFSFTGLSREQSLAMTDRHHVYMLPNGRISMAGVTPGNVKKIAAAIHDVVTTISAS